MIFLTFQVFCTVAILYAGTGGEGIFKSEDSGESWHPSNTNLSCPYIFSLAIDPSLSTTLYAGTLCGLFKSTDSGRNWTAINHGLPETFVFKIAIDPVTPTTLFVGTEHNPPAAGTSIGGSVFKSTDGGESWFQVNSGLPDYARVHSLALDPVTTSTLYVGISVSGIGIYKTTDGGQNWRVVNNGLPTFANIVKSLAVDPITPTTLYAGTDYNGIFKSIDAGQSWEAINDGLFATNIQSDLNPLCGRTTKLGRDHCRFSSCHFAELPP